MKKRVTITLDGDVVDFFQEKAPRKVSVSEVIAWIVRSALKDIQAGRGLSSKELQEWIDSTPEGKDFRERLKEHWGPGLKKIDTTFNKVKEAVRPNKKKGNK